MNWASLTYTLVMFFAEHSQCSQKFDHIKKSDPIPIPKTIHVAAKPPKHDRMSRYLQVHHVITFTDTKPKVPKLFTPHPKKDINTLIIEEHAKKS